MTTRLPAIARLQDIGALRVGATVRITNLDFLKIYKCSDTGVILANTFAKRGDIVDSDGDVFIRTTTGAYYYVAATDLEVTS